MTLEVKPLQVTLTENAISQIKSTLESQPQSDLFLRIYVQGGCGGISYGMALDNRGVEGDEEVIYEGIRVVVDKNSMPYVTGANVDFETGSKTGFKIDNPDAADMMVGGGCSSGSCGSESGGCGAGSGGCC